MIVKIMSPNVLFKYLLNERKSREWNPPTPGKKDPREIQKPEDNFGHIKDWLLSQSKSDTIKIMSIIIWWRFSRKFSHQSITNPQSSIFNHQSSIINHQSKRSRRTGLLSLTTASPSGWWPRQPPWATRSAAAGLQSWCFWAKLSPIPQGTSGKWPRAPFPQG